MTSVLANFYDRGFHHDGPGPFGWLFLALLLVVLILGAVALATRVFGHRAIAPSSTAVGPAAPPSRDTALEALRLRYARGEVSREEFLRVSADLGHPSPPGEEPASE